ncbi:hypothetical protein LINGRAHAP2_LOCUS18050, partial [Linum grandiflorum]
MIEGHRALEADLDLHRAIPGFQTLMRSSQTVPDNLKTGQDMIEVEEQEIDITMEGAEGK